MQKIVPIRDNVIFQFCEDTVGGQRFINSTGSGIIVSASDRNQSAPRWVKITHVGPDVDPEIKSGDFALVEAGKWTIGFTVNRERFWKTDEAQLMVIADEPQSTY